VSTNAVSGTTSTIGGSGPASASAQATGTSLEVTVIQGTTSTITKVLVNSAQTSSPSSSKNAATGGYIHRGESLMFAMFAGLGITLLVGALGWRFAVDA